jgi:hypothetical protein
VNRREDLNRFWKEVLISGLAVTVQIPTETMAPPPNWYLRWRAERFSRFRFSEGLDAIPPEALLQQVWAYQRINPEKLRTRDGRRVRVLHPGFLNREAGPDFRGAIVQVGDEASRSGDVEIDLISAGWEQHSHANNPAYANVVLHVTWEPEKPNRPFPSVALKQALDSPLSDLAFWLGVQPKPQPEGLMGQCSAPLRTLDSARVREILKQAAQARLRTKAEQLQARARQVGWEGALWEGLFSALGYKRNVWPMRRLAELRSALCAQINGEKPVLHLQARLFGVAGFLPTAPSAAGEMYLRTLWQTWWRESAQFREQVLPSGFWNLAGIRPANHPQRRLALAAHWLAVGSESTLLTRLEHWLERKIESPDLHQSLTEIFEAKKDEFWSYRWTFRSTPFGQPQQLLGEQRVTDLAMNVVLPWLFVRACAGLNEQLAAAAEARYLLWPAGEDNSVLKLARQRLFGGIPSNFLKNAADQQGLIQIVRDFCDHSNAACEHCVFPELVSALWCGK